MLYLEVHKKLNNSMVLKGLLTRGRLANLSELLTQMKPISMAFTWMEFHPSDSSSRFKKKIIPCFGANSLRPQRQTLSFNQEIKPSKKDVEVFFDFLADCKAVRNPYGFFLLTRNFNFLCHVSKICNAQVRCVSVQKKEYFSLNDMTS